MEPSPKGMAEAAWPCSPWGGPGRAGGGLELAPDRGPLVVGHHRELDVDVVDPVEGLHRGRDPLGDLGPQGAAGDGEGDGDADPAAVDADAP